MSHPADTYRKTAQLKKLDGDSIDTSSLVWRKNAVGCMALLFDLERVWYRLKDVVV